MHQKRLFPRSGVLSIFLDLWFVPGRREMGRANQALSLITHRDGMVAESVFREDHFKILGNNYSINISIGYLTGKNRLKKGSNGYRCFVCASCWMEIACFQSNLETIGLLKAWLADFSDLCHCDFLKIANRIESLLLLFFLNLISSWAKKACLSI